MMSSHKIIMLAATATLLAATAAPDALSGNPGETSEIKSVASSAATTIKGRLEVMWGDPKPGAGIPHRLHITLVDEAGLAQALRSVV